MANEQKFLINYGFQLPERINNPLVIAVWKGSADFWRHLLPNFFELRDDAINIRRRQRYRATS